MAITTSPAELLKQARVSVAPETFYLVGMRITDWQHVLQQPDLSSNRQVPYMILRDQAQVTLLLDDTDWLAMRHAARDAKAEGGFRLVTLDVELNWNVTGFLAHVTAILAAAEIPVGALSAFSRDHLLIKQQDLGKALLVLGEHVAELC